MTVRAVSTRRLATTVRATGVLMALCAIIAAVPVHAAPKTPAGIADDPTLLPDGPSLTTAADRSLTVAAYRRLGIPDPAQQWSVTDTQRAMTVLKDMAVRDPTQLPRRDNPESGRVFRRLIAPDAPAALPADATPAMPSAHAVKGEETAATRFFQQSAYAQALGGLERVYTHERKSIGGIFDAELVEAVRTSLERTRLLLDLLAEAHAAGPHVLSVAEWKRLHAQVTYGATLTLRGAVFIFSARGALRPAEQKRLETALVTTFKPLLEHLPASAQADVRTQIDGMLHEEPNDAGRAAWRDIYRAVQFANPAAGEPGPAKKRGRHKRSGRKHAL